MGILIAHTSQVEQGSLSPCVRKSITTSCSASGYSSRISTRGRPRRLSWPIVGRAERRRSFANSRMSVTAPCGPIPLDGPEDSRAYVHLSVSAASLSPRRAGVSGRRVSGQSLGVVGPPQYDPLRPGALACGHPQRASTLSLALRRLCASSLATLSALGPPSTSVCVYS